MQREKVVKVKKSPKIKASGLPKGVAPTDKLQAARSAENKKRRKVAADISKWQAVDKWHKRREQRKPMRGTARKNRRLSAPRKQQPAA